MPRIATHQAIIDQIALRALADAAGCQTQASAILASVYDDYRYGFGAYEGAPSPFIRPDRGIDVNRHLERNNMHSVHRIGFDHRAKGFAMRLTVFDDNSCLLTTKMSSKKCKTVHLVPWVFMLSQEFEAKDRTLTIPQLQCAPMFSFYDNKGSADPEYADLFKSIDPKREDPLPRDLRRQYLSQLKREMLSIVQAFTKALPISTGRDWIDDALKGEAVIPPNFTYKSAATGMPSHARIMSFLSPYIDANFPTGSKIRGTIYGRTVTPSGMVGDPVAEIFVNDEKHHGLGWAIDALLNDEAGPIPLALQIAQTERGPRAICLLHLHQAGRSTAHEQIESTALINRYAKTRA